MAGQEIYGVVVGSNGKSAYQIAVQEGYSGTEAEWLETLKGDPGENGLKGDKGDPGENGLKGDKGDPGENAKINGVTTITIAEGENITLSMEGNVLTISSTGGSGGVTVHNSLTGKDAVDQHPISSITGLEDALGSKLSTESDPTVPAWAKAATKPTYTKNEIGLGSVDNTSDVDKPISTAVQTALNNKLPIDTPIPEGLQYEGQTVTEIVTGDNVSAVIADGVLTVSATDGDSRITTITRGVPQLTGKRMINNGVEYAEWEFISGDIFTNETTSNEYHQILTNINNIIITNIIPVGFVSFSTIYYAGSFMNFIPSPANILYTDINDSGALRIRLSGDFSSSGTKAYVSCIFFLPLGQTPTVPPNAAQRLMSMGIQPAETIQEQQAQLNELGVQ